MRYLTVMPDYTSSCIKDDFGGQIDVDELDFLPQEYVSRLNNWHTMYRAIIPLSSYERAAVKEKIDKLDEEGLALSKELRDLVPGGAKVKYYSEGHLKLLFVG